MMTFSSLKNLSIGFFVLCSIASNAQLSGTYTIDSATTTSGTNYQSFTAAVSALTTSGVSGAVTFNVLKGTYSEQISIGNITGASVSNNITFKGKGAITKITAAPPTSKYPIIGFNAASHIVIDSIKIEVTGTRGWGVHFMNKADSISIKNCEITAPKLSTCYGIVASSSITSPTISNTGNNGGEYITILNNTIEGGNSGVFFKGTTGPLTTPSKKVNYGTDLHFEGNEIVNFRAVGIDISYNHNVDFIGNTVSSSETTAGGAFRFWDAGDNCNIIGNSFYISSNTANSRVVALSMAPANGPAGVSTLPITIANNFIQYNGSNSTAPTGLLLKNKAYIKVYHNTISVKNQGTAANCIWFDANNTRALNGIEVRNNVFQLENSGSGRFFNNAANGAAFKSMVIDHNNFYAPSNYFSMTVPNGVSGTSTYSSLTAYKASSYGSGALNVDPQFSGATNLHVNSPAMNDSGVVISSVTTDIDGEIRSTISPDMGADEYTPGQVICAFSQTINACNTVSVTVGTSTYTTAGVYTDTLVGVYNCDSIVTTTINIGLTTTAVDTQIACDSYKWTNGITYTSNNITAMDTLTNNAGCDSIVTLNLTMRNSTGSIDTISACDSYLWRNGQTYFGSTKVPTYKLVNSIGCDSIITLHLTIRKKTIAGDVITACDSLKWINGTTYTSDTRGVSHILTNAVGCDSTVILDLTVNKSTSGTDVKSACALYTWIDGNTYTANNNSATHIINNTKGCDSTITLDLTITPVIRSTDVQVACDEFTWIDGITYTSNNTTAIDTLPGSNGCDSIITLDLTINTVDTTTTTSGFAITASQTGGTYRWLDCDESNSIITGETKSSYTATKNGSFSVEVTSNGCVDTSSCVSIDGVGFGESYTNSIIRVFPNPNNGTFKVDLSEFNLISPIQILNVQGQVVFESKAEESVVEIELNEPAGIYFLQMKNETGSAIRKIIIE